MGLSRAGGDGNSIEPKKRGSWIILSWSKGNVVLLLTAASSETKQERNIQAGQKSFAFLFPYDCFFVLFFLNYFKYFQVTATQVSVTVSMGLSASPALTGHHSNRVLHQHTHQNLPWWKENQRLSQKKSTRMRKQQKSGWKKHFYMTLNRPWWKCVVF